MITTFKSFSNDKDLKLLVLLFALIGMLVFAYITVTDPSKAIIFFVALLIALISLFDDRFLFAFIGIYIFYSPLLSALSFQFISTDFNFSGAYRNFLSLALFLRIVSLFDKEKEIVKRFLLKDVSFIALSLFILWQFFSSFFTPYDAVENLTRNFQIYTFTFLLILFFYLKSFNGFSKVNAFLNIVLFLFFPSLLYAVYEMIVSFNPIGFYLKLVSSMQSEFLNPKDLYYSVANQSFGQRTASSFLRPSSFFHAANNFSFYLNIILMILLYKISALKEKEQKVKFLLIFYSLFVLIIQFTTLSRTGFLQILAVLFVHLLISNKPFITKMKDFLITIAVLAVLIFPFFNLFLERSNDGNIVERLLMWKVGLKVISEYVFFGIGPGNIMAEFSKRFYPVLTTHNAWLDVFVISGFMGVFLMVVFYSIAFFKSLNLYKKIFKINKEGRLKSDSVKDLLSLANYSFYLLIIIFVHSFSEPFSLDSIPMVMYFSSFAFFSRVVYEIKRKNLNISI